MLCLAFLSAGLQGAAVHASNHRSWTGAITMITIFRFVVEEDGHGCFAVDSEVCSDGGTNFFRSEVAATGMLAGLLHHWNLVA